MVFYKIKILIPRRNSLAELFFDLKKPKPAPITADDKRSIIRRT